MSARRTAAILAAALVAGALAGALILSSDHLDDKLVWSIFGQLVGWSFIGTGLYAQRRRPDSRAGVLMVALGFAWFANAIAASDAPVLYTTGQVTGGLWGGIFLHLVMTFPSGRIRSGRDRAIVIAGYLIFTLANVPALLFATPGDLGCDDCPRNLLLITHDESLVDAAFALQAALYAGLFLIVLVRLALRWRQTPMLERLQLTPVYASGMITFLAVTIAVSGGGDSVIWPAFVATALLPFAFLGGLLRSHVARLDAELRASRLRLVEAGDTERRRLERNLHDGAQARLVALAMQLGHARRVADSDPGQVPELLDGALGELRTSLAELRELAHGIHPAVLSEKGLDAALYALASRAPMPVTLASDNDGRLPEAVEVAAYYAVSEALTNVAKYAQATHADIAVHRANGTLTVDVTDDGIGGADAARGSGLRGLADRVAALDGTLSVESPPGHGTRLHVEIAVCVLSSQLCTSDRGTRRVAAAGGLGRAARIASAALLLVPAGCATAERAGAPVVRFRVGEGLGAITVAGGDAWVNDYGREEVVRIDGRSGRVLGRLPLGRREALATTERSVWALRWGGRFFRVPNGPLVRIDARTGRITQRLSVRVPSGETMIAFGVVASGNSLWVWGPDRVLELGASSGLVVRYMGVDQRYGELTGVAPDGGGGLLATTGDGHLSRTAPAGVLPGRQLPALSGSELQAASGGRAFASRGGGIVAVSADGARTLWRRQLGFRISTILPHEGVLLAQGAAFRDDGDRLWALDPATGRVLASARIPSFGTTAMAFAGGALWVTTAAGEVIVFPALTMRLFIARARSRS